MKKSAFIILLLLLNITTLFSNPNEEKIKTMKTINSDDDLDIFHQYYYIHPRTDLIVESIKYIINNKYNDSDSAQRHHVPFYGELFKNNKDKIKTWFNNIEDLSDSDIYIFSQALYWTNSEIGNEQIKTLLSKTKNKNLIDGVTDMMQNHKPFDPKFLRISNVEVLDMLWNTFFASGDEAYVIKIINACYPNNKDANSIAIYTTAQWSLKTIASTHIKVYNTCKRLLPEASGEMKKLLQNIVNR